MTTSTITTTEAPLLIQPESKKIEELIPSYGKYKVFLWEFETPIKWVNVFFITLWHALAVWTLITRPFWHHWSLVFYCKLHFICQNYNI